MQNYATNGQGDFMKRHGFIGSGGRMSYVTGIPNFLHEKNREADVGFNRLQNRLHNLGYTQKDINAALLSLLSRFSKTGELSRLTRRGEPLQVWHSAQNKLLNHNLLLHHKTGAE